MSNDRQEGFTLIEVMLAMTITAILMGCVLSFVIQGNMMLTRSKEEVEQQQSLGIGLDKITRELLTADQLRFADNQLGFQPDKDAELLTFNCNKKLVNYYVDDDNELSRSFSGVGLPIANRVKALRLVYYDSNGKEIYPGAPASAVVRVKIELTGDISRTKEISLTSAVSLRTKI